MKRIENDRDRKMTIMTTTFIPCGAKMPIVGLIAGALFHNAGWVATSAYHAPSWKNVLHSMWERGWSFIKRAGTIILVSSILIWFLSGYGWAPQAVEADVSADAAQTEIVEATADDLVVFGAVEDMDESILGKVGSAIAPVFSPMGFGNWQSTVATVMGLVAKEEVVSVFGVLYGVDNDEVAAADVIEDENMSDDEKATKLSPIMTAFEESSNGHGRLAACCFLLFNLLCAPCFAAMGAIKREMNNGKWTAFAIAYQCGLAYVVSFIVYRPGLLFSGAGFTLLTAIALVLCYMIFRKNKYNDEHFTQSVKTAA